MLTGQNPRFIKMENFLNQKSEKSKKVRLNDKDYVIPTSPHERYAARPDELEHMCFAQFMIWYEPIPKHFKKQKNNIRSQHEVICPHLKQRQYLPFLIHLKDSSLGSMKLRQFEAVLKFHKFRVDEEPHEFFYSELVLYKHWRSENELRQDDFNACLALYRTPSPDNPNITVIETVKNSLFPEMDNVEIARAILDDFTEDERPCHIGNIIDNQNEQDNEEQIAEGMQPDLNYDVRDYDGDFVGENLEEATIFKRADFSQYEEMRELVKKLVPEQRRVFDKMIGYAKELRKFKAAGGTKPKAPLSVVHGGAGSGKSTLIKAVSFWFEFLLTSNDERDLNMPIVIRCAPTGMAANNIDGLTVCSAFKFKFGDNHIPLDAKNRTSYQVTLSHLQLVIIDEMSMVKADDLYKIHLRLQEIKSNFDEDFGGVSIVLLGDLMQLQPVMGKWIFEKPRHASWDARYNSDKLWELFTPYIFSQNHRQGEDKAYADLLNRLRFGQQTEEDIKIIRSRIVESFPNNVPEDALMIYGKNEPVAHYNNQKLEQLEGTAYKSEATHLNNPGWRRSIKKNGQIADTQFQQKISLKVGARVMLIYNVRTSDGLTNGACGEILALETKKDNVDKIETIIIAFDQVNAGQQLRSENPRITKQYGEAATPIKRISFEYSKGNLAKQHSAKVKLIQFPVKLAWAITAHKIQGQTVKDPKPVGLDLQSTFACAQSYVMLGRTENLNQIFLAKFDNKKLKVDKNSLKQNKTLDKRADEALKNDDWLSLQDTFRLSSLNIRSLLSQFTNLEVDYCLLKSDVIALSETWCSTKPPELEGYNGYHVLASRGQGISFYIRDFLKVSSKPEQFNVSGIQILKVQLEKATLILVYRSPSYNTQELLIKELLKILPRNGPTIVCGDFNIHPKEDNSYFNELSEKMTSKGFFQHIDKPTHKGGNMLDHLYIRNINLTGWQLYHPFYSDHDAICCMAKL